MGLFDIFTGGEQKRAAQAIQAHLNMTQGNIDKLFQGAQAQGLAALQSGQTQAQDQLSQYLPSILQGRTDITDATTKAASALGTSYDQARDLILSGAIPQASGAIRDALSQASGTYAPALSRATSAANLYADALGVNGPDAASRAMSSFTASPAYQFNLDQGLEAINRSRAAQGYGPISGNQMRESQQFGSGLASQEYGGWRAALGQFVPQEASLAQGLAGLQSNAGTAIANLINQGYTNLANASGTQGANLANLYSREGGSLSDLLTKYGTTGAQLGSSIPQDTAARIASLLSSTASGQAGQDVAIAKQFTDSMAGAAAAGAQGTANLWNLVGNAAKLGLGLPPVGGLGLSAGSAPSSGGFAGGFNFAASPIGQLTSGIGNLFSQQQPQPIYGPGY